jgi:CheY-like chemotaxis protein
MQNDGSRARNLLSGLLLLCVDRDEDTRDLMRLVLEQYGAHVHAAASAREALELLTSLRPRVVISDIAMPGTDGCELVQSIRALPHELGGMTPAIAVTGYTGDEDRELILASGFQRHLAKPVDIAMLVESVARAARGEALAEIDGGSLDAVAA